MYYPIYFNETLDHLYTKPCAVLPDYLGNNCKKTFSHTQYKHNFFQIFCSLADELLVGKINCISPTVFDSILLHKI